MKMQIQTATRSKEPNKISNFVQAAIYAVFILAAVSIAAAIGALYESPQAIEVSLFFFAIGFISMALAGYILFQSRKRVAALKTETPQILTTVECSKCGIKTTREFQRGDYVFKELEQCDKCDDKKLITAIYREVKTKEKPPTV